jgi:hypothetical protein
MKQVSRIALVVLMIVSGLAGWWVYKRSVKNRRSRSYPAVLMLTDVNGDRHKDTIVVYEQHDKQNMIDAFDAQGRLLWTSVTNNVMGVDQHSYAPTREYATSKERFFLLHREFRSGGKYWVTGHHKKDGALAWHHDFGANEELSLYAKLLAVDGLLLVFTSNRKGRHKEYLTALDEKTGKVRWRRSLSMRYPRSPWVTGKSIVIGGTSSSEAISLASGEAVSLPAFGPGVIRGSSFWYAQYNRAKRQYELARHTFDMPPSTSASSRPVRRNHTVFPFPRMAAVRNGWGLFGQHVFVFSGKGVRKERLHFLPIVRGEKETTIQLPDGFRFSTTFTDWQKRAPQFAPLLQGHVPYLPLVVKKRLDKTLSLHKIVLIDLKKKKIAWQSKPHKGKSLDLRFEHIMLKNGRYYLHLPFRWGHKYHRALAIMDGHTGKLLGAHVVQWKWKQTQKEWHTACPKARPWWISFPLQVNMIGALRWRVDMTKGAFSLHHPKHIRWVDVRKQLEKTWGAFR